VYILQKNSSAINTDSSNLSAVISNHKNGTNTDTLYYITTLHYYSSTSTVALHIRHRCNQWRISLWVKQALP